MFALAETLEKERLTHAVNTVIEHKVRLGQYFTPYPIARFMASLFPVTDQNIRLLDPGAGFGTLACSFLERIRQENWKASEVLVSAYDIDESVLQTLEKNIIRATACFNKADYEIVSEDFLAKTAFEFTWNINKTYTHVIMNPPYKKIATHSAERHSARVFGLETVNSYTAFVGAAITITEDLGYIVAIIPRSFCNGVYYKPFRKFILKHCAIKYIHLFKSRNKAFKDEAVLQENIIIMLQKKGKQESVRVSYCTDESFVDFKVFDADFTQILNPSDKEKYLRIPEEKKIYTETFSAYSSLKDLHINVSTGPVVDFRKRDFLLQGYQTGAYPLVYPIHLRHFRLEWPKQSKKPNAILYSEDVSKLLFPKGFYVAVKRFSTKEETKRIVASLITPQDFITDGIAFENHLNIFHINKASLSEEIAYGLICWLNSTYIDRNFRLFSGHTQVNATDLRNIPYPNLQKLKELGKRLQQSNQWNQRLFDSLAESIVLCN
ncbi:N-6 DNA methylase [Treponema socranskii subsp. buccale]|jgi:modification methylase bsuBI|uniref:Eco57I restriction-modification methylase domain-containing protein n=1 Tax=Treponema socranskii TaxID=53419 RepID=UPI0020A5AB4F|nr:N-6 DNA methylase [Treponema socranskii]UTD03749.1 N-6 DNA methylase [Treponema socranskii subsp. buccale]